VPDSVDHAIDALHPNFPELVVVSNPVALTF
jgi:hypothetical protein